MDNPAAMLAEASCSAATPEAGEQECTSPAFRLTKQTRMLAGLLVFSLALTLALLLWSAERQDQIAIDGSRHLATTAITVQLSQLERTLTDYTYWDEAYENTAHSFNPDWFDEEFGAGDYLGETFGITWSFVIDPENRTLRLMRDAEIAEAGPMPNLEHEVEGGLGELVRRARHEVEGEFRAASGLLVVDGRPYFAAVRAIHPNSKELLAAAAITPATAYVAGFMRPLDVELLQTFAHDFGLDNLRCIGKGNAAGSVTLPLDGVDGRPLDALAWQIDLPSRHVKAVILPALLAVILCVGLLSWYVLHSLRSGQKELWHALKQAKSADQSKTEFLANMSHELRTPLNAIIGFAEMMRDQMFGPLGHPRYAEYSANIHESGVHLLDIISDILEMSKVEAGKLELQETRLVMHKVMTSACRLIEPRATQKSIRISVDLAPNLPEVFADERALKQILINLLSNAVKFTPEGGRILVAATVGPRGTFRLAVSDTGVGIPKRQIPWVMQPFHQSGGSATASEGGSGLGLPLTASLVALHQGEMRIESEVGQGTTVIIDFPRSRVILPQAA